MTKRWKLKTNSSNILLVLITLILVKAEWAEGAKNDDPLNFTNSVEDNDGNGSGQTNVYIGNDQIAEYFFGPSANNSSFILQGINRCLDSFQLITCVKMLLLSRVNEAVSLMEEPNISRRDVRFLNGLLVFKIKNETTDLLPGDVDEGFSLEEEITAKVKRIFWGRTLQVNLLPNVKIEIEPAAQKRSDFLSFSYKILKELEPTRSNGYEEGRKAKGGKKKKKKKKKGGGGKKKKKGGMKKKKAKGGMKQKMKGGGGMPMMMFVPPLIMLGLMPFTLASLKAMVMNAAMINMMALNGAIFMTIRNLVFGPRGGDNVKYVNYGYSKDRQTQSKRPVLIIHSPAAFVKQPPVHNTPFQAHYASQHVDQNGYGGDSHFYGTNHQNIGQSDDYEYEYYVVEQPVGENHYHTGGGQVAQRRNQPR